MSIAQPISISALRIKLEGVKMKGKYEIIETMATIKRDITSYGFQFSLEQLDVEELVQDSFDFKPYENRKVKVIILIPEKEK